MHISLIYKNIMAGIPAAKLIALTMKTVAKPFAKVIQNRAQNNESFRKTCVWIGNTQYKTSGYLNRMVRKQKSSTKLHTIDDVKAVQIGSDFLGQTVVYSIGVAILAGEYRYNNIKKKDLEKRKEDLEKSQTEEIENLQHDVERNTEKLRHIEKEVDVLMEYIKEHNDRSWFKKRPNLRKIESKKN